MNLLNTLDINLFNYETYFTKYNLSSEFYDVPSKQHYRLLSYLSTLYNNIHILAIGTHLSESSLALSYNESNQIHTFDISHNTSYDNKVNNIYFHDENIFTNLEIRNKYKELLLTSTFIFLDFEQHNGTMEYDLYLFLKQNNYNGFVICNNIWAFKEMRDNFWYRIEDQYR